MYYSLQLSKQEEDWLWLCSIPGLYWKQRMTLLHYFGSAGQVRRASREEFSAWERLGLDWAARLYPAYENGYMEDVRKRMEKNQIRFISMEHPDFPEKLKQIYDCPQGLFYKGYLPSDSILSVGIVGARSCSSYGAGMAAAISKTLAAQGIQVISGMAYGIDGIAQRAALSAGAPSFAVLGSSPEICYPRTNYDLYQDLLVHGGVISEFPCGTSALPSHFPLRNRIISGLSHVLIVIEARKKSGSLITADLAIDQGREVYALPGRTADLLSYGCNHLIEQGAGIILSPEKLLEQLKAGFPDVFPAAESLKKLRNPEEKPAKGTVRSQEEKSVCRALDQTPKSFDQLTADTKLSGPALHTALLALQLDGLVIEVGKGRFALKTQ